MPVVAAILFAVGGWVVPWQREAGVASIERSRGAIRDVFLFAAQLDPEGRPVLTGRASDWSASAERARAAGARVWLTVVNDRLAPPGPPLLKDAEIVARLLHDDARRGRHRAEIVELAGRLGAHGVDLDYENLPASERDPFSQFVSELAAELREKGLALSVTVQPKRGVTGARGPGAMDWPRLCAIADRVQVMLYNEHNASTEPGPIAGIDWISAVADYGLSACPAGKLVAVLKVSGMDWGPEKAEWRSFAEIAAIRSASAPRLRRERKNKVPWFVYRAADGRHIVYFEDARSLEAKAEKLRMRGLSAIMLWSLGSEDPETIPRLDQNR